MLMGTPKITGDNMDSYINQAIDQQALIMQEVLDTMKNPPVEPMEWLKIFANVAAQIDGLRGPLYDARDIVLLNNRKRS